MDNSTTLTPKIITPFNYHDWREDMKTSLCNKIINRMTTRREVEPQQHIEKIKYLDGLDEYFGYMWIDISKEILFHLGGLMIPKELWDKLKSFF